MSKEFSPMTSDSEETSNTQAVGGEKNTPIETASGEIEKTLSEAQAHTIQEKHEETHEAVTHSIPNPLLNFLDAGFSPDLQEILNHSKWKTPRQLDGIALPHTLQGEDLLIQAASKTSAIIFLTLSHQLAKYKGTIESAEVPQALVVYSSVEAAEKACHDFIRLFGATGLMASALTEELYQETEGQEVKAQAVASNIIFASPSSLKNASMKNQLSFANVLICICRDVDTVRDTGSSDDLDFVLSRVGDAQKIFFSTTLSSSVKELATKYMKDAKHISLERERATISSVTHQAFLCETPNKFKTLLGWLKDHSPACAIVYANSKLTAAWLYHKLLENSFAVAQLSSELPPPKRVELAENVKDGKTTILVATDFESRHFTFPEITHVFNFDLPENGDFYLSRMGQVGKDGQGFVCSLVCDEYGQNYQHVYDLLGQKAPKPVWAKEEYLSMIDKSGNPFLEKNIGYVEKRPGRDFGDRPRRGAHDGDRSSFPRKERFERPERSERSERPDRGDRPERISARGPRIEERKERGEHFDRNERSDRMIRSDRDRDDIKPAPRTGPSAPPTIKPRTRRAAHNPNPTVRPIEQQRRVIPKAAKKGMLSKILSFFFSKKKD
jgi:superfamily II DNA/RNA helicase